LSRIAFSTISFTGMSEVVSSPFAHDELGNRCENGPRVDAINLCYTISNGNAKIQRILRRVSFTVLEGEMCALIGPSGAGKR
jgi:ABC-type glutathione transport system ATPase component